MSDSDSSPSEDQGFFFWTGLKDRVVCFPDFEPDTQVTLRSEFHDTVCMPLIGPIKIALYRPTMDSEMVNQQYILKNYSQV